MDIKNDLKNGIKLCADAATDVAQALVEKSRLKAKANRIKQVIKADTELMNQAYIELGRYFYENLRDDADQECEALCVVVDKTTKRIDKASRKYVEIMSSSNDVNFKSENTEKIKKIVSDTAEDIKDKAKETGKKAKNKATDLSDKAKLKAQDISAKAKVTVADFKDKAKDKAEDFKAFIGPDETDEDIINEIEEEIERPAEVKVIAAECEVFADDSDDEMADIVDAPAKAEAVPEKPADTKDVVTYSIDDEESPEEFEF